MDIEAENSERVVVDSDDSDVPELAIICTAPNPNALLVGAPDVAHRALARLLPRLAQPVATWHVGCETPPVINETGTLVIWNVEQLTTPQQRWLMEATERSGEHQIIAVTAADVFASVECGDFLDMLYYRLNTVLVFL